jgi:hypothetical protein
VGNWKNSNFIYAFMYAGIAFLDAVRASLIGLQNGKPPTS